VGIPPTGVHRVISPKIKILRYLECFYLLVSLTGGKRCLDVISCEHLSIMHSACRIHVEICSQIVSHPTHIVFVKEEN
jgi:hypothetical protein